MNKIKTFINNYLNSTIRERNIALQEIFEYLKTGEVPYKFIRKNNPSFEAQVGSPVITSVDEVGVGIKSDKLLGGNGCIMWNDIVALPFDFEETDEGEVLTIDVR